MTCFDHRSSGFHGRGLGFHGRGLGLHGRGLALLCATALALAPLTVHAARLTYDSANRLVRSDDGDTLVAYRYDGMGNLVRTCVFYASAPSECVDVMVDTTAEFPTVVGEIGAGGTTLYAHGPTGLAAVSRNGTPYYPLKDHQGSVRGLVDGTGQVAGRVAYDAYGHARTRVGEQISLGYTGEWTSRHGLVHLRARTYAPEIGRFLQRDDYVGSLSDPLSLNRYTYAHNNPLLNTDPSGHVVPVLAIGAAVMLGLIFGTAAATLTPGLADLWVSHVEMSPEVREATAEIRREQVANDTLQAMVLNQTVMTVAGSTTPLVTARPYQPPQPYQQGLPGRVVTMPKHQRPGITQRARRPHTTTTQQARTTQPPSTANNTTSAQAKLSKFYGRLNQDATMLPELAAFRGQIRNPNNSTVQCVVCAQRTAWALSGKGVVKVGQSAGEAMYPLRQATTYHAKTPQELQQLAFKHLKPWQQAYVVQNTRVLADGKVGGHIYNVYSRPLKPGGRGVPVFVDESANVHGSLGHVLRNNGYPHELGFELRIIDSAPVVPPGGG